MGFWSLILLSELSLDSYPYFILGDVLVKKISLGHFFWLRHLVQYWLARCDIAGNLDAWDISNSGREVLGWFVVCSPKQFLFFIFFEVYESSHFLFTMLHDWDFLFRWCEEDMGNYDISQNFFHLKSVGYRIQFSKFWAVATMYWNNGVF